MPGKSPPDGDEKKMTSSESSQSPARESQGLKLRREHKEEERAANFSF